MVTLLATAVSAALVAVSPELETASEPPLGALMQAYHETGHFDGAVLVAKHDQVLFVGAYGLADRSWGVPNVDDGLFRVGSVTKQFTAAVALRLVEEGVLSLDDTVSTHLPELDTTWAATTTIEQLLASTSGLPHYRGFGDDFLYARDRLAHSREDMLELFGKMTLEHPPGEHNYSSPGFHLAGLILESASGRTYSDLVEECIFEPLGMQRSSIDDHRTIAPRQTTGYRYDYANGRYMNVTYRDPSTTWAAGGLVTTVHDLHRWAVSLLDASVLSVASIERMTTTTGDSGYGLGVRVQRGEDLDTLIHHGGMVLGHRAHIDVNPDTGLIIILLANRRDLDATVIRNAIQGLVDTGEWERPRRSVLKHLLPIIASQGIDAAIADFERLEAAETDEVDLYSVDLLVLGIELRSEQMLLEAATIFELYAQKLPESPYFAMACLQGARTWAGIDQRRARRLIELLLDRDPTNEEAGEMLESLDRDEGGGQ